MCRTPHARGDVKCNRTLHDELRHAVASTPANLTEHQSVLVSARFRSRSVAPPSPRHHAFCFDLAGGVLFFYFVWWWRARSGFSKGETDRILSANSVDEVLQKLFSGGKDFAKLRLNLFLHFVRPQKGVWGMNAGGFWV